MSRSICLTLAASLTLAGCNQASPPEAQYDDSRNPHYKQAQQDLDANNPAAAAQDYEAALAANPKLVEAQYELGILYGDKLQDPVYSIFHFRRYLELAPNSDHAANAKQRIEKESLIFVASQPTQNGDQVTKLQADNVALKKQVDDAAHTIMQLQVQLAKAGKHHAETAAPAEAASPAAPASPAIPAVPAVAADSDNTNAPTSSNAASATPPRALPLDATNANVAAGAPAADAGSSRSYTVVKGDSLWKIAHKMYPGDTKNGVDKIQEANKDAIGGKPLKIGQVLVIPQ